MKRTIVTTAKGGRTIKTENGKATRTKAFYVRKLKDFVPLPNGFNLDLANAFLEAAEAMEGALWDQNAWRAILTEDEMTEDQRYAIAAINPTLLQGKKESHCGAAMCAAGWVGELTGADWIVDVDAAKTGDDRFSDRILVRLGQLGTPLEPGDSWDSLWDGTVEKLKERGFSPETHHVLAVSDYAARALGISGDYGYDRLDLFNGDNQWWDMRGIIDAYATYGNVGPDTTPALVMARGEKYARVEWGVHDNMVAEALESMPEGKGWDYHRENAPEWALRRAGELVEV